ncbi:MAG: BamA/TamA family outer membrane protein [Bacteroidota bacterium]|nr:BamA/TamA family outer membrane protein [Bacteroidota bacterium]
MIVKTIETNGRSIFPGLNFSLLVFLLLWGTAYSLQAKGSLFALPENDTTDIQNITVKLDSLTCSDSLKVKKKLEDVLTEWFNKGYIAASIDSFHCKPYGLYLNIYRGKKWTWGKISFKGITNKEIRHSGIGKNFNPNELVSFSKLTEYQNKIVNYFENNGYPYASIQFREVHFQDNTLNGQLQVEKNTLIQIDTVIVKSDQKLPFQYIQRYVNLKKGEYYNQQKISEISSRIKELGFLKETKPHELYINKQKASIYLFLTGKNANQFNGLLGFSSKGSNGKIQVTGEASLLLINSFKKGETLAIQWKRPTRGSQDLTVQTLYPCLFSLPLALDASFQLYKKDSDYLTVNPRLGLNFLSSGNNQLQFFINFKSSSLLSNYDASQLTSLPPFADTKTTLYGLGYNYSQLDYKFNPSKGISVHVETSMGTRKISKNSKIPEALYSGIQMTGKQIEASWLAEFYFPTFPKNVIKIQNHSALLSSSSLFDNDLYYLGGIKTIRGFDENSIRASSYSIMTLEYRFLFGMNSCLFFFADGAYYEKRTTTDFVHDTPLGFGTGINLETKVGIFTVNYGLGKQFNNPIEIRTAKIHFGYISRF